MRLDRDGIRQRLRELPPERGRAIRRAVRRGEAVADPRDAALAAEVAARMQGLRRIGRWYRKRWIIVLHVLTLVGAAYWVVAGEWWLGALLIAALVYPFVTFVFFDRLADRARLAEEKNRALAGTFPRPET